MKCPDCKGSGKTTEEDYLDGPNFPCFTEVICVRCAGQGFVKEPLVKITEEYKTAPKQEKVKVLTELQTWISKQWQELLKEN